MIRVGIAGVTGYTGVELVRLLRRHPEVEVRVGTSEHYQGQPPDRVYPHLQGEAEFPIVALEPGAFAGCDAVFLALPHGVAGRLAPALVEQGIRVIDLGADFRLRDPAAYQAWYRQEPPAPDWLRRAVYGLPELFREQIRGAQLVANPGCYPTACTLAAAPLIVHDLVDRRSLIFDAKSGVSGAGRGLSLGVHFAEVNENFKAYNIAGAHRHTPEIEQNLTALAGEPVTVTFTPHLVPMTRGILVTAYFQLKEPASATQLLDLYRTFYAGEPFVRIRPEGDLPQTKQVWGSNYCDIGLAVDRRTGRAVVVAAIDNLVKGAAGQAVQNLNLLWGLPETLGLEGLPVYP
ncbi:MAG: N-acetyl-gamma-glutamyl-phosphate reductase [Firmicutes bacterium]|nr:N-acetyl-gamma-glutamyl-phosphate reductase [Bacillota bacterium]